jgi:hypothetical protein
VSGDDDVVGGEIKTPITFVVSGVSKENTSGGPGCQFVSGFDGVIRIAGTTEHVQVLIGGGDSIEGEVWTGRTDHLGGEAVQQICDGADVACLDAPFLQTASDEVVAHPDVLAPFIENGVLGQGQSGLAVHSEFHHSSVSAEEITKQSNKPERLSRSGGGCYVLGLAAGQGHHLLLDRLPANETLAEEEEDPACALAGVDVISAVAVAVPYKVCLPRAPQIVEAVVESPRNIADDPLHSLLVLRCRSLHESTNVADEECQVRPCLGSRATSLISLSSLSLSSSTETKLSVLLARRASSSAAAAAASTSALAAASSAIASLVALAAVAVVSAAARSHSSAAATSTS